MNKIFKALLTLCLAALIASGCAAFYFKVPESFWENIFSISKGETCFVVIKPGMNARQSAKAFFDQGALTDSPDSLARWMVRFKIDRKFKPGIYEVGRSDAWNMARQLKTAQPAVTKLTVIPGADIFSLRELFTSGDIALSTSSDSLAEAIMNDENYPEDMRSYLPNSKESRIAFFMPDTYFVLEETPDALVKAAGNSWWERYKETAKSVTSEDLLVSAKIASMAQREALWKEELPTITAVIKNRLNKKMPLQIDATVVYAWKIKGRKVTRLYNKDLTLESPYNTYVNTGLPPSPICVPSSSAWDAALGEEKNNYYYYVAGKDGRHYFAETYTKHLQNVKKARSE